ncbi:MAG: hypothetical protein O2800_02550 [Planctomycetota bacterium]|nr:hypothetical protein [Planctomycetota bacterium]
MMTIDARLQTLESEMLRLRQETRRWRRIALGLAVPITVLAGVAATQASRVPDVIRTHKLEIVDAQEKVVVVANSVGGEGRIDVWNGRGSNVIRLGCNPDGGDFLMWSAKGKNIASLYAQGESVNAELRSAAGDCTLMLRAGPDASGMSVFTGENNTEVVALGMRAGQSALDLGAVGSAHGAVIEGSSQGGIVRLSNATGQPLALVSGAGAAGRVEVSLPGAVTASILGADATRGGFAEFRNTTGATAASIGTDAIGAGALQLNMSTGARVAGLETNEGGGATLSFWEGSRRMVGLGCGASGGLLNLCDGEGRPVIVAGPANDADGGAVSIRSGAGIQLARLGVDVLGAGEVAVYSGTGTSKRVLGMGAR